MTEIVGKKVGLRKRVESESLLLVEKNVGENKTGGKKKKTRKQVNINPEQIKSEDRVHLTIKRNQTKEN